MAVNKNTFIYDACLYSKARQTPFHDVPLIRATSDNVKEFGNLVSDFHEAEVKKIPWPKPYGWRRLTEGTGSNQPLAEGDYVIRWDGEYMYGDNMAVGEGACGFVLATSVSDGDRNAVLTRDTNYHPDGSQVFFNKDGRPFVILMAPAVGDDVHLEDFKAFWFDGSAGFNIAPNVWHNTPFTADRATIFLSKQPSTFACVEMDSVVEFGKFFKVPLIPL